MTAGGDATAKKTSPETNARDARTGPSDQTAADKGGHHRRERLSRETPKLVGGAGPRLEDGSCSSSLSATAGFGGVF